MLHTICKGIKIGDLVLCPDGEGNYFVGEVKSNEAETTTTTKEQDKLGVELVEGKDLRVINKYFNSRQSNRVLDFTFSFSQEQFVESAC